MSRSHVTALVRRSPIALALAGLVAVAPTAIEPPAQAMVRSDAPAADGLGDLHPLAEVSDPALQRQVEGLRPLVPVSAPTIERVERVADRVVWSTLPQFPVEGDFNLGQSGAEFGASRSGRMHEGQDVFARTGAPLVAVREGRVVETGDDGGRGNYVAIHSPEAGQTYVYLHMQRPSRVGPGERVVAGQRVGEVGCTGSCFGDHLHFEVRPGATMQGRPVDPEPLLARWAEASDSRPVLPPGES